MNVTFQIMCHIVHVLVVTHKNVCTKTHPKKYSFYYFCALLKKKKRQREAAPRLFGLWLVLQITPSQVKYRFCFPKTVPHFAMGRVWCHQS